MLRPASARPFALGRRQPFLELRRRAGDQVRWRQRLAIAVEPFSSLRQEHAAAGRPDRERIAKTGRGPAGAAAGTSRVSASTRLASATWSMRRSIMAASQAMNLGRPVVPDVRLRRLARASSLAPASTTGAGAAGSTWNSNLADGRAARRAGIRNGPMTRSTWPACSAARSTPCRSSRRARRRSS